MPKLFLTNPYLDSGEVIIVFGRASVTRQDGGFHFDSSADLESLRSIYYTTEVLRPPKWPAEILGKIDMAKAARGERIYVREQCVTCHANRPYPRTDPSPWGKQFVKTQPTPIDDVGTEPEYAKYFVTRKASPGILAPVFRGTPFEGQQEIPAAILFLTILQQITNAEIDRLDLTSEEERKLKARMPTGLPKTPREVRQLVESLLVYKAAPTPGIWSTAPYLHNGSVPNLYQLLLPPHQRDKKFYLGNREFDPKHVGYRTEPFEDGYKFDTQLPGFSNIGHTYGTDITDKERWELLEYLKTL